MNSEHLTELPGTGWRVWRDGLLRSAGFPVDVLESFAAPECAEVADAHLDGLAEAGTFTAAFDTATAALGRAVHAASADPRFREAITWQNPGALNGPTGVLRDGPDAPRNERRRRREEVVAKYAQRYSGKNDTIGFFGPMCWVEVDAAAPPLTGGHGPELTRVRAVFFEWWALVAVAENIAEDEAVRPWLPVALQPQLTIDGRRLLAPGRQPVELSAAQAAVLSRCDGRSTAREVAMACVADPDSAVRNESDVDAMLELFVRQETVRWEFVLPMNLSAEEELHRQVTAIGDEQARKRATATLDRIRAARDTLAAAEGPEAVAAAMAALESEFTEITGRTAQHRAGRTYAGRTLCHLETARDAEFSFGGTVLAALAPLDPLLRSTRWLTSTLARTYRAELTALHAELAAESGSTEVPFGQLWFLGLGSLFGARRPADAVIEEFGRRWTTVLGLDNLEPGTDRLDLSTDALAEAVAAEFGTAEPGWATSRLHAPDVHLCAPSAEALARGEFGVVLGELHIGMPALDTDFFRIGHPDTDRLLAAMRAELPTGRAHPLLPPDWPKQCARNADWMYGPEDVQLGFTPAPGADPDRLLPITALTVVPDEDGTLLARTPDGRGWPLLEMFASFVGTHAFDTWKLAGSDGHTPRVTVDGLVLVRRTWRCTVAETGLTEISGERDRYLAVRRWARELGLPQRVFVRVGTEIKPCFADLTSPVFTRILCTLLRSARRTGGPDTEVAVTEMLPTPDQAWLTDAEGRRYCSELRLHVSDPAGREGDGA
ncbi:lantibiotic dehydratase [Amycolatopsis cihanbeyliensis]|uniref:Lantibiotic biosynthesis dehydratase-like protein n=1 Tax=Amycolatopsis cihanbeyliensis TaxID=1128664 RepID=A0A542DFF6_AMYCI|nr:lantibiotic dehydratase [Amycolatopsis cihanbeyliensis]TQJ01800.1 lantibiotic biosynthesis dehydratase-like protein [Amycolatopsis cihanbeyliensis]